ncbi:MAG TPA: D-glycero-beta-D-manno-heptose 1-phosphate adenylyltransferase [Flavobacteriales bacterium]|nr:D-glycero-beta-D-manno-heptose 1-phosphate adenylyltransferase [Flavobacteriales bacterium]
MNKKIIEIDKLESSIADLKRDGLKIVFTNGCFDILHLGHIDYLSRAASFGDILIIGVNTDESVKRLKGSGRPINDESSRAQLLAALEFVDAVVLFNDKTPIELIKTITPDILAKGGDYKAEDVVGYEHVITSGGEMRIIDFLPGYSTSSIIQKILALNE